MSKELEDLRFLEEVCCCFATEEEYIAVNNIKEALHRLERFDQAVEDINILPLDKIIEIYKNDLVIEVLVKKYQEINKELQKLKLINGTETKEELE